MALTSDSIDVITHRSFLKDTIQELQEKGGTIFGHGQEMIEGAVETGIDCIELKKSYAVRFNEDPYKAASVFIESAHLRVHWDWSKCRS